MRAVETLRAQGYEGSITLLSAEGEEPYNLPPLSKEFLTGALDEDDIRLHTFAELEALDIKLICNAQATGLDTASQLLRTTRADYSYDTLIVATGSTPVDFRTWTSLDGVKYLRTLDDARAIRAAMTQGTPRVVIVGGGFIGCEIASSARFYGLDTTIIEGAEHILGRALSPVLAEPVVRLHTEHGVRVECGRSVRAIRGSGRVNGVDLDDGTRVEADLVIAAIGARPVVDWLEGSNVDLADGILVDATLQSSACGVYAIGDVARWSAGSSAATRVEHWTNAKEQGAFVARHLLDPASAASFTATPYVWSDLHGQRLQAVGEQAGAVRFVIGEPGSDHYLAALVSDGKVVGGVGFGAGKHFPILRRFVEQSADWPDVAEVFGVPADGSTSDSIGRAKS